MYRLFYFIFFFLLFHDVGAKAESADKFTESKSLVHIGAIFDPETLDGAVAEVSINLAISDFYAIHPNYQTRLYVNFATAKDLVGTAAAAGDLLKNFQVKAIIGPQISAATSFLVELGEKAQVPIISLFQTNPTLFPSEHPYFVRVGQDDSVQVKALLAILQKFEWHEVVLVYEYSDYGKGFISYLLDALQESDIRVAHMSAIATSAPDFQISGELTKLRTIQTRVFIVHMNTTLASRLFALADKAGMMSMGYAWLITACLSNSLNVLDFEVNDSMEGVLGIRSYVPKSKELGFLNRRWKSKLHSMKPNSSVTEINISGLWAYDTICALARAVERTWQPTNPSIVKPNSNDGTTFLETLGVSQIGPTLLNEILNTKFTGLSGEFHLVNGQLESSVFEIINVIGTGRVVAYWTSEKGITQSLDSNGGNKLKKIIWPGDSTIVPKGWAIPSLRVGIPGRVGFPEFLKSYKDERSNKIKYSGFCIDVFCAVLDILEKQLGTKIRYKIVPFEDKNGEMAGTYDELLRGIEKKKFDAVVGDVTIVADRTDFVDFTMPYTESGVTMLVPVKHDNRMDMWIFLKPWTWDLWLLVFIACIVFAAVLRIMEHSTGNSELGGSPVRQLGMILMFPYYALFLSQREVVVKDCSKFVLVIWLWLAFILLQSYTASLSSILTVGQLEPKFDNLQKLRSKEHLVGFQNRSFVRNFLVKQLNFSREQIRPFNNCEEFKKALTDGSKNGGASAILEEIPFIRVFLNKYGSKYTTAGPIYRTEGFGFAFPRHSPLVSHFSKAILVLRENRTTMNEIESKYFGNKVTSPMLAPSSTTESSSLRAYNFGGLFIIAGIATLLALVISESYIWQKPVALVRHYLLSQRPTPNEVELVAPQQALDQPDASEYLPTDQGEDSGSSERNSDQNKEITSEEEDGAENAEGC